MPTTFQLLSDYDALRRVSSVTGFELPLTGFVFNWQVSNASMELTGSEVDTADLYSAKIYPNDATPVVLWIEDVVLKSSDIGRLLSFNAKASSTASFSASVTLSLYNGSTYTATDGNLTDIESGTFTAMRSNTIEVGAIPAGEDYNKAKISIYFSGHNGQNILFTAPHLIHDFAFYSNDFVAGSRQFLPDFYWEKDGDAEYPDYPFFRLIDILTSAASDTRREVGRMYGFELSEFLLPEEHVIYDANSSLVSSSGVRDEYAQWLCQFTGEKLYRNFQDANGDLYFDNPSMRRDFIEWQIAHSHYGRAAGTRRAIIEAAQQVLIKTKDGAESTRSVAVTPSYLGDPFVILVQTLENETIDANEGESSYLVSQSVALAKPLGYSVIHSTETEFFFTLDSPSLGVLDELRWG